MKPNQKTACGVLHLRKARRDCLAGVTLRKVDNAGYFEPDDLQALLRELPEALRAPIELTYFTGWRLASEILPLKWSVIDRDGGYIGLAPGTNKERRSARISVFDVAGVARASDRSECERRRGMRFLIAPPWARSQIDLRGLEGSNGARRSEESMYSRYAITCDSDLRKASPSG
jgi:integrase